LLTFSNVSLFHALYTISMEMKKISNLFTILSTSLDLAP
jgi:hypothetical protein